MSSFRDEGRARLLIEAPPFVDVRVVDEDLREVALPPTDVGASEITLDVAPGSYDVTFRAADAQQTLLVLAAGGQDVQVAAPPVLAFSTPAPYEETRTTHEYQRFPAQALSQPGECRGAGEAAVFVFARDADVAYGGASALDRLELEVDGLDLRTPLAERDQHAHWAALHVGRDPGVARLVVGIEGRRFEHALALVRGYQTQVFVLAGPRGIEPGALSIALCRRARGFDPADPAQRQTALAMQALEAGRWTRGLDRAVLFGHLDETPLLGLLGAHLLLQGDVRPSDVPVAIDVAQGLRALLGPLPDVVALRLALRVKLGQDPLSSWGPLTPLAHPPMLYKSWKRWVQASQDAPELVPEDSVGDRIALGASSSGPWLTWPAGLAERPPASQRISPEAGIEVEAATVEASDALYRQIRLPRVTARREASRMLHASRRAT